VSEHVSVRITLLDKQIVDSDRLPIGRVDDLDLSEPTETKAPSVDAILTGAQALGDRLGGVTGRWIAQTAARLRPRSHPRGPTRIDPALVDELEPFVQLSVRLDELPHIAGLERWLARHAIEPLPGAGDARE
jgi:hypothetical protein